MKPAKEADAHQALRREHDLASILSHVEERVVGNDYTVRYAGRHYQIERSDIRPGLRGGVVRVEQRLDGELAVRFREGYLRIAPCEARSRLVMSERPRPEAKTPTPSKKQEGKSWMGGFDVRESPPLWAILRQEQR